MGDMVGKCGTMGTERNVADRQPDRKIKRRYYFHNFFFFLTTQRLTVLQVYER